MTEITEIDPDIYTLRYEVENLFIEKIVNACLSNNEEVLGSLLKNLSSAQLREYMSPNFDNKRDPVLNVVMAIVQYQITAEQFADNLDAFEKSFCYILSKYNVLDKTVDECVDEMESVFGKFPSLAVVVILFTMSNQGERGNSYLFHHILNKLLIKNSWEHVVDTLLDAPGEPTERAPIPLRVMRLLSYFAKHNNEVFLVYTVNMSPGDLTLPIAIAECVRYNRVQIFDNLKHRLSPNDDINLCLLPSIDHNREYFFTECIRYGRVTDLLKDQLKLCEAAVEFGRVEMLNKLLELFQFDQSHLYTILGYVCAQVYKKSLAECYEKEPYRIVVTLLKFGLVVEDNEKWREFIYNFTRMWGHNNSDVVNLVLDAISFTEKELYWLFRCTVSSWGQKRAESSCLRTAISPFLDRGLDPNGNSNYLAKVVNKYGKSKDRDYLISIGCIPIEEEK